MVILQMPPVLFLYVPLQQNINDGVIVPKPPLKPLGLDVAAGYTCTLSLVGNLLADLLSGERREENDGRVWRATYATTST
jgi:hypothetical protein